MKNVSVIDKLLCALGENNTFEYDEETVNKAFRGINRAYEKKWLGEIVPYEVLSDSVKASINKTVSLSEGGIFHKTFPKDMHSPNYGNLWGRLANYIEINNRYMAEMEGNRTKNGIFGMIKILPAIPPSAFSFANCIIISQIFPNIFGDGWNKGPFEENSVYGMKLGCGYSENIISYELDLTPEEQLRAFCELCWFRGIKAGFRIVISQGQMQVCEEGFDWCNDKHLELFIQECTKLVNLGFEAMFIDSAKHIGGYDCGNYTGVGDLPEYHTMQYILNEIRRRSGNPAVSFAGEKSTDDFDRYKNMGLTTGTDFITGDDFYKVRDLSEKFKYSREYAPGVEVENDNTEGGITYEQRLNRIRTGLFGYYLASDKLPLFMQTNDIFPLRYDTNTHHIMMTNPSYSTDGTPNSHYLNAFAGDDGKRYNKEVGELFAYALQR